jgi:nucleoside-diphosphate-sugar epimerase
MRIFVTGASGWIGSALVPELLSAGHGVVGLARSDASAATLEGAGTEVLRGALDDLDTLRAAAAGSDGVIHLAYNHSTDLDAAAKTDSRVIEVLGEALEGSGRPLVIASGTPNLNGRVATERDEPGAVGVAAARGANARAVIAMAGRGVRSCVVRLPRSVHGEGDLHGFVPRLIATAHKKGVSGYVGDGSSRWPAVHVLDAARLFRLAVEEAPGGSVLHAVGDEGVPTYEIAGCIGRHLNLPTASVPAEDFGFLGLVLAGDQPASSALTRELFGWRPVQPGLIEDLNQGHYFVEPASSQARGRHLPGQVSFPNTGPGEAASIYPEGP